MSSRLVLAAGLTFWLAGCSPNASKLPANSAASTISAEALKALNEQDFDRAATLLTTILETEPNSRPALFLYTRATQQQAFKKEAHARWELLNRSARAARKLRDLHPPLNVDEARLVLQALYNDACARAQLGQPDQALRALGEAVDAGWNDAPHLEEDADLESIRDRPEFARLLHDAALRGAPRLLARNHPFPFTLRLPDAKGKLVSLDDFKGKVVIVNFWASWSPPCRRMAPFLTELDQKYREKGLEIVGLNDESSEATVNSFLTEFPSSYRQVRGDEATKKMLPHWDGYPTTLLIDKKGRVRLLLEGFGPAEAVVLEEAVTILLEEK